MYNEVQYNTKNYNNIATILGNFTISIENSFKKIFSNRAK